MLWYFFKPANSSVIRGSFWKKRIFLTCTTEDIYFNILKVKHNLYSKVVCDRFNVNNHSYLSRQTDFELLRFNCGIFSKHSWPQILRKTVKYIN